tara:strand:+ start:4608 stop:5132 length:525 start_codon:yes stop_codon:yes gene_type:complete
MSLAIGMAVGGAILGKIGADRRRREVKRQRRREKKVALRTQQQLMGSIGSIRSEYRQRASMARDMFSLGQRTAIGGYTQDRDAMDNIIGQTNMAYSGGAQQQSSLLNQSFQQELSARQIQGRQDFFNLNQQYQGELRDVQVGLLNLEANAARRGYSIPSMGANFKTNYSVGGVV